MYYWIIPAWILSCIATFWLGYFLRGLAKKVAELQEVVKSKVDKRPPPEEPKSTLLDPDDPVQEAMWEHKKLMERLNPEDE